MADITEITSEELEKISRFARKPLESTEVYHFPVILCDNEIDRDGERFSIPALQKLAELFVGRTGIFDHNPKGENQSARIYETEIRTDGTKKTAAGEDYTTLVGRAYMIRTAKNADLIAEIDGGIKKEVSVSCSVKTRRCSVCGADTKTSSCAHRAGKLYNGKRCHFILENPTDAYEWSFVAVPAQPNAGVTKKLARVDSGDKALRKKLDEQRVLLDRLELDLRGEVTKLCAVCEPLLGAKTVSSLLSRMETEELLSLKEQLSRRAAKENLPQLAALPTRGADETRGYKLH